MKREDGEFGNGWEAFAIMKFSERGMLESSSSAPLSMNGIFFTEKLSKRTVIVYYSDTLRFQNPYKEK